MRKNKQLAAKLAEIMAEIETVPKNGHNDFHNYDYATEADILAAVRSKLAARKVFIFTSTDKTEIVTTVTRERKTYKDGTVHETEKAKHITALTTLHTIVDGESGEQFQVNAYGQGEDSGDKGGYKALTGAIKYFLLKTFLIPTGDDPEATDGNGEKTEQSQSRSQSRAPAAPSSNPAPAAKTEQPKLPEGVRIAFDPKHPKMSKAQREFALDVWHDLMNRRQIPKGTQRDAVLQAQLKRCYQCPNFEELRKKQVSDFIDQCVAAIEGLKKLPQTTASMGSLAAPAAPGEAIAPAEAPSSQAPAPTQPAPISEAAYNAAEQAALSLQ